MALFQRPGEEDYGALLAENRLIGDIQLSIETALADRQLTQSDLAKLLGVSPARVSQMLGGNGANLTARTVARTAYVLGLHASIVLADSCPEEWWHEEPAEDESVGQFADWVRAACVTIEEQGHVPVAPSNDSWTGGSDLANIPAVDSEACELVAA